MQELKKIFTVTELTLAIKQLIEPQFAAIQVEGEITNLRKQSSGHYYFSLKDSGALISAVLFRGNAKLLSAIPKEGDQVLVTGELSLYAPRGGYQIVVREMRFAGMGELLIQLQKLKEELKIQGFFDPEKKKPLPKYPKTIGVVTSPTGSVIQDILHVLTRRFSGFHLVLNPVRVQGNEAAGEIAKAIDTFNQHKLADVLIVGRGGGSLQDLWPFNEKSVVDAVYRSKIPIISAVGHETDFTLCDFACDVRAPTPSAAAEIVLSEKKGQLEFLRSCQVRMKNSMWQKIKHLRSTLKGFQSNPFYASPYLIISPHLQRMDDISAKFQKNASFFLQEKKFHLEGMKKQLQSSAPSKQLQVHHQKLQAYRSLLSVRNFQKLLQLKRENLLKLSSHLESIDPRNLLTKGYCIPFAENSDSVIISTQELEKGQKINLLFKDGKVLTEALEIQPK